jgi:hypothetical protein
LSSDKLKSTTFFVKFESESEAFWRGTVRLRPKSQNLIFNFLLIRMLSGLTSLCIILAEWRYLVAQSTLYNRVYRKQSSLPFITSFSIAYFKLFGMYSITRKIHCKLSMDSLPFGTTISSNLGVKGQESI